MSERAIPRARCLLRLTGKYDIGGLSLEVRREIIVEKILYIEV